MRKFILVPHARTHVSSRIQCARAILNAGSLFMFMCLSHGPTSAQCPTDVEAFRWNVKTIPWYFGDGFGATCAMSPDCVKFKLLIPQAVSLWNSTMAFELSDPIFMSGPGGDPLGPSIGFYWNDLDLGSHPGCSPTSSTMPGQNSPCGGPIPPGAYRAWTQHTVFYPAGGGHGEIQRACVHFSENVNWSDPGAGGYDRMTHALHEIGHALGLAHAQGSSCLMTPDPQCNQVETVDPEALDALYCLYAPLFADCVPQWNLTAQPTPGAPTTFRLGHCNCSTPVVPEVAAAALSYELAVSENGGPYSVFATLGDADWVDGAYQHAFATSYAAARFRIRVRSGATLMDESFTSYPVSIAGPLSAPSWAPGPRPVTIQVAPSPFTMATGVMVTLARAQAATISVYDIRGRRLATLYDDWLEGGRHEFTWRGRLDDGSAASQGTYWVRVLTTDGAAQERVVRIR